MTALSDTLTAPAVAAIEAPLQPDLVSAGMGAVSAFWVPAIDWASIRPEWDDLTAVAEPNVFLAPAFALAARGIASPRGLGALLVSRDGEPIGLVAGRFGLARTVFTLWTHDYAPYGMPLVRPGEAAVVAEALFAFLAQEGIAALEAPLLDAGPFAAALDMRAASHRMQVVDAHRRAVLTEAPPPLSKEHRRLARRLGERGCLVAVSTAAGHDPAEAVAAFLALEAEGWKGRRGTALATDPATQVFFEDAIGGLAVQGRVRIDMLLLDGRPIAAGLVLSAGARAWYLKTTYDEAFARYSPGVLLSHGIGKAAISTDGVELVDSCAIPGHSMIERIWPGRMALSTRLVAIRAGRPGWRYHASLACRRAFSEGKAMAKCLLRR